jgi:transketolase
MMDKGVAQSDTTAMARAIRRHALRMTHAAKASHIGSGLSMADILAVLYGRVVRVDPATPSAPDRDRVIVSKGHAAAAVYAALAERGFIARESLQEYCTDASLLTGHVSHKVPGVEVSTGSLGHGLPIGCGLALAGRRAMPQFRVFVVLSDGELNEGSNWEALLFAGHHKLSNLVAIVDYNRIQSFGAVADVLELGDLGAKVRGLGWDVVEVDGHDHQALLGALGPQRIGQGMPLMVVARTVKGKGVSFMENRLEWHYRSVDVDQLEQALDEVGRE